MMDHAQDQRRTKAKNLRYKKAIVKNINLEFIMQDLWDIQEACEEVRWFCDSDDGSETLLNALDGDDDDASEFKMAFADLCSECETMFEDMEDEYVPDCFNDFFVAIRSESYGGGLLGFDEYEGDYFGIDLPPSFSENESGKRVMRLTKKELLEAAGACLKVYTSYLGLKSRYDDLKAAMDILRAQNAGYLKTLRRIDELYSSMWEEGDYFARYSKEAREWDRLTEALPQEAWIQ